MVKEKQEHMHSSHYLPLELGNRLREAAYISRKSQNQIIREALEMYIPILLSKTEKQ